MDNTLLVIFAGAVILIPLIIIHEFGHLLACKSVGIAVLEFGLGFPPRALKLFRWGETEFTLNSLPLGGFVMPFGEDFVKPQGEEDMYTMRDELIKRGVENPKSVNEARPIEKIWFLFAGPLANFIAALVLFIVIALTGAPIREADVTIAEVFPETEAASKALRPMGGNFPPDVIVAVNGQTFRTSEELEELLQEIVDENPNDPVTFTIQRNDPVTGTSTFDTQMTPNLAIEAPEERVRILEVQTGTPAEAAGFQNQDLILAVNGEPIDTLEQMTDITADNEDQEIVVTVERGGENIDLPVTPERLVNSETGDREDKARIGITINILTVAPAFGFVVEDQNEIRTTEALGPVESIKWGTGIFTDVFKLLGELPGQILRGEVSGEEARPVSPVGVAQIGAQVIKENPLQDVLMLIGFISIALGVSNLLPIPGLDGGRILFVIVEIIRGKPMSPEREGIVHLIGFILMLILGIALIINDLVNPINVLQ